MEKDIEVQADALLRRLVTEKNLTDVGRQALSKWFLDQLELERRGWKSRLHDASKAADSERRETLNAHTVIQRVSQNIEERLLTAAINHVQSDDIIINNDDDVDQKAERLQRLERSWEATSKYLERLEAERNGCLRALGVTEDSTVDMCSVLEVRLAGANTESTLARHRVIADLSSENDALRSQLMTSIRSSHDAKQKHNKDVAQLQKIVQALERRLEQSRSTDDKAIQVELSSGHHHSRASVPRRQRTTTRTAAASRRTSTGDGPMSQPPLDSQPTSATSSSAAAAATSSQQPNFDSHPDVVTSQTPTTASVRHRGPAVTSSNDEVHRRHAVRLTVDVTSPSSLPALTSTRWSPAVGSSMTARKAPTQPTMAVVLPSIMTSRSEMNELPSTGYLRSQVMSFVSKLNEARREMEECHKQLVRLQHVTNTTTTSGGEHVATINMADSNKTRDKRRQRQQQLQLATKSVTTLQLQSVADVQQSTTPRSYRGPLSDQSMWRLNDEEPLSYNQYARKPKQRSKHWRT